MFPLVFMQISPTNAYKYLIDIKTPGMKVYCRCLMFRSPQVEPNGSAER